MPRPTKAPTRPRRPLSLAVTERRVYQVADPELATDIRKALADGDLERLGDLLDFVADTSDPTENAVLDVEVKR